MTPEEKKARNREACRKYRAKNLESRRADNRDRQKTWRVANRETDSARTRASYAKAKAADPAAVKRRNRAKELKRLYGIDHAEYEAMLARQEFKCAICSADSNGSSEHFHVDHSHAHGHVRGLLCLACNTSLGGFKDSQELLLKAAAYLDRTNRNPEGGTKAAV